ncbi:hypothetical protein [Janthinobacterium sp. CAN_S7]|uniref:hypothetical protein n=1 Tax=Janthinobacterium sp. CAN_S7 TaxID=3071704 RepID=UPI00319DDBB9
MEPSSAPSPSIGNLPQSNTPNPSAGNSPESSTQNPGAGDAPQSSTSNPSAGNSSQSGTPDQGAGNAPQPGAPNQGAGNTPQPGTPTAGAGDQSEGSINSNSSLQGRVTSTLTLVANDVKVVRRIHYVFALAAAIPVGVLLYLLWTVVCAFSTHVGGANAFLLKVVEAKPVTTTATIVAATTAPSSLVGKTVASKAKADAKDSKETNIDSSQLKDGDEPELSDQAHLYKMISSYQTSLSTSSVAVISILVIAIVVITVAILRSALALEPYDPSKKSDSGKNPDVDGASKESGYAIPLYEFGKRLKELFSPFFEKK